MKMMLTRDGECSGLLKTLSRRSLARTSLLIKRRRSSSLRCRTNRLSMIKRSTWSHRKLANSRKLRTLPPMSKLLMTLETSGKDLQTFVIVLKLLMSVNSSPKMKRPLMSLSSNSRKISVPSLISGLLLITTVNLRNLGDTMTLNYSNLKLLKTPLMNLIVFWLVLLVSLEESLLLLTRKWLRRSKKRLVTSDNT